ncbi:MAG: hypothetical protein P1U36_00270 [Legionellaceae bacterium]|nr:hypothetical protein [Legionellaceae bacterium]
MTGTRVLTAVRSVGPSAMRAFKSEAVAVKSVFKSSPVNWFGGEQKIMSLGAGAVAVTVGAAATLYHEYTSGHVTPTASSTVDVATAIGYQAVLGILGGVMDVSLGTENTDKLGLTTHAQSQVVAHDQRQRMSKLEGARHVVGVNAVCDEHGIPLSATIADLFILHHEVNPDIGSSLDSAFEQLIIEKFQEEFDEGMSYTHAVIGADHDLAQFAAETNQRKLNSVSAVGVGAHTSFHMLKEFMHKFKVALVEPARAKQEMYGLIKEKYSEQYQADVEAHKGQITQALSEVRRTIREHRDSGTYERHSEDENNERDSLIKKSSEGLVNTLEERVASNIKTTISFMERMQAGRDEGSPTLTQDKHHDEEPDIDDSSFSGPR